MEVWVFWSLGALILQSIKIYWQNWTAQRVSAVQHVQLVSAVVTIAFCILALSFTLDQIENISSLLILAGMAGIGYALGTILGTRAQRYIPISIFHSVMRLSLFLPIPVFYFLLNERPTLSQWTGIFSTLVPLVVIAFLKAEDSVSSQKKKGLPFVAGAILALSALKIIDTVAMKVMNVSPLLFTFVSNIFAALFVMSTIRIKKDKVTVDRKILSCGLIAGILNFLSFMMYLKAIETGVASVVIPFLSLSVFLAITLTEIFPTSSDVTRDNRKSIIVGMFVMIWVLGVAFFIGYEN